MNVFHLQINVEFDAFKPEESDFQSMKILLQQTFRDLEISISDVANIIISQNFVGSVIKVILIRNNLNEVSSAN